MNNFWTWTRNGALIVTTPDEVDMANEGTLRRRLLAASAHNPVVLVDAATCGTFFDVQGMRVLHQAGRAMANAGGELRVVTTRPQLSRFLEVGGFDEYPRIFESLDEALSAPWPGRELQAA